MISEDERERAIEAIARQLCVIFDQNPETLLDSFVATIPSEPRPGDPGTPLWKRLHGFRADIIYEKVIAALAPALPELPPRPAPIESAPRDGTEIWLVGIYEQEGDWRIVSISNCYWHEQSGEFVLGPPTHFSNVGVSPESATHWLPKAAINVDGLRGLPPRQPRVPLEDLDLTTGRAD